MRFGAILSPYSLMLLMLISIFGIRPLLMPEEPESFDFYGYAIGSDGFEAAGVLGFAGTLAFVLGFSFWRLVMRPKQTGPGEESPEPAGLPEWAPRRSVLIAVGLSAGWFLFMIVVGGGVGFLTQLFAGRSETVIARLENVPAFVGALPTIGCLTVAAVRFQYERVLRYTRPQSLAYWLVVAGSVVPPMALGTRRYLIPSILIAVVGAMAGSWNRRIKPRWIGLGVLGLLALAIIPFVRSAGSRTKLGGDSDIVGAMGLYFQEQGLSGTLNNFFLSYDTEMFNYLAYMSQTMGNTIPFGMGRGTIGELIAMPIPDAITPFQRWNDFLLMQSFGTKCGYGNPCPVPSIVGVLFSDLALPGIILGMIILGIMAARFDRALLAASGTYVGVLLLTAGFAVAFARGNSLAQVWIAVQCFIVWWGVQKVFLHAPKTKQEISPGSLPEAYRRLPRPYAKKESGLQRR